jgi:hypothetical protein
MENLRWELVHGGALYGVAASTMWPTAVLEAGTW